MKKTICLFALFFCLNASASQFDELDKAPEGAHGKQMILMGFVSIGVPFGNIIDAENSFIDGSTYTFISSDTTKKIDLSNMVFNLGISFEYMPIDYVGLKVRVKKDTIIERTTFGTDYKNWSETLISAYAFNFGIPVHFTLRQRWDISLVPYAGYYSAEIYPTPVAKKIIDGYISPSVQSASGYQYGAELNFIFYFSGGFTLSAGADWSYSSINIGKPIKALNIQTGKNYPSSTDLSFHSSAFILSAGYAFYN